MIAFAFLDNCAERFERAIQYGVNIADNARFGSKSYCKRLETLALSGNCKTFEVVFHTFSFLSAS